MLNLKENYLINLLDLGCGAGHFVKALEQKGISATGYDTSVVLCKLGNKNKKKIKYILLILKEFMRL